MESNPMMQAHTKASSHAQSSSFEESLEPTLNGGQVPQRRQKDIVDDMREKNFSFTKNVNIFLTVDFEKKTLSSKLIRCGSKGVPYSFRSPIRQPLPLRGAQLLMFILLLEPICDDYVQLSYKHVAHMNFSRTTTKLYKSLLALIEKVILSAYQKIIP